LVKQINSSQSTIIKYTMNINFDNFNKENLSAEVI